MKQVLKRVLQRGIDWVVKKSMPTALESYYSMYSDRWHPHHALRQHALDDTVDYIKSNMPHAMIMENEFQVLKHALRQVTLDGLYLEFGVRTGTTINHIARIAPGQPIYGFDSFEGLPEDWSGWVQRRGSFGGEGVPDVRENVELVSGWFDESLPAFLATHPGDVAFAHVDSDLYSSARTVLTELAPRIKPGTVIVFNEYFNYPNWREHEYKAFRELCDARSLRYEYLCWGKFEVAVKILGTGSGASPA